MMRQLVGELRLSQAVHTFGIGSSLDLPHLTAVVHGLEEWLQPDWDPANPMNAIHEERLLRLIRSFLGPQVKQLTSPPIAPDQIEPNQSVAGIPVSTFPRWARCPRCEILAPLDFGIFKLKTNPRRPDETQYVHENCSKAAGTSPTVNPVRFVFACRNGHISDFPWEHFIQNVPQGCQGRKKPCGPYRLQERGVSSEVADLWVRCDQCNASRQMIHAFGLEAKNNLGPCSGHHPHLGRYHTEECEDGDPRAMLLGASNQWFAMIVSALWIPPAKESQIASLVKQHWALLENMSSEDQIETLRRARLLHAFSDFSNSDIWNAMEAKRSGDESSGPLKAGELKVDEWKLLSEPDTAPHTDDFRVSRRDVPPAYRPWLAEVVAVERLRVVKALTGFTRIDSPGDYSDLSEIPDVQWVRLGREAAEWVPAFQVRGEGVFLRLREDALAAWRKDRSVQRREAALRAAHVAFRASRDIEPADDGFDVLRFALLHTLSHALIRQFSIECGYSAASIQERIYSVGTEDEGSPMAGILLMTAAADSEGTLGGLVNLAKPQNLGRHLRQALDRAGLCASDPLCSEHRPDTEGRDLHGAACHACSFVSETSCERGNKYLDRSLLVETMGAEIRSFFGSQWAEG
jgi:hypothetical protein